MLDIKINVGNTDKIILRSDVPLATNEIQNLVQKITGISKECFYVVHNGHLAYSNDICQHGCAILIPRLLGGKGGFGSMLRAIGAQIEKTTNREACRDLSGRRLRDINEEKRLKAWIDKQTKREEEAAERKKKKLERLCAEPRHEFKDQNYEQERSVLTDKVRDAVEEGFKAAVAGTSSVKRKTEEEDTSNKKKRILLDSDLDIDSDELDSSDSDDSSDDEPIPKKTKLPDSQVSNDSGNSSDKSDRAGKTVKSNEKECSESSLKNDVASEDSTGANDISEKDSTAEKSHDSTETSKELEKDFESKKESIPDTLEIPDTLITEEYSTDSNKSFKKNV